MKTITVDWLKEKNACSEGIDWYVKHGKKENVFDVIKDLKKEKQYQWANWLLSRTFTKLEAVKYAIFAAEQVIGIFEKKYPNDNRPRKAIEAAKVWLKNPNEKNRNGAYAAAAADAYAAAAADAYAAAAADAYAADGAYDADAADAAAAAADAADAAAADAAAYAAADAYAADDAAYAADAADADAAANGAADADAKEKLQIKIINYGIKILKVKEA
jgi:hypothetical protein